MAKLSTLALASALAVAVLSPTQASAQWRGGYHSGWGGYHGGWGGYRGGWGYGGWGAGAGLAAGIAGLAIGSALASPAYGYGYGYGSPYYAPAYGYSYPAYGYAPAYGRPVVVVRRVYRPYHGDHRYGYWNRHYYPHSVAVRRAAWHGARRS